MKTFLRKTKQVERYLFRQSTSEERLVFEAQLVLDSSLRDDLQWQQRTYDLIRQYGRQQLRDEIKAAERQLFRSYQHRSFQRMIRQLFLR